MKKINTFVENLQIIVPNRFESNGCSQPCPARGVKIVQRSLNHEIFFYFSGLNFKLVYRLQKLFFSQNLRYSQSISKNLFTSDQEITELWHYRVISNLKLQKKVACLSLSNPAIDHSYARTVFDSTPLHALISSLLQVELNC